MASRPIIRSVSRVYLTCPPARCVAIYAHVDVRAALRARDGAGAGRWRLELSFPNVGALDTLIADLQTVRATAKEAAQDTKPSTEG